MASVILESIGLALNYVNTRDLALPISSNWHVESRDFFSFVTSALPLISTGPSAVNMIALGVILLMLTPYVRVVASVVFYGVRKDYKYLGITLLVLTIITISLLTL